MKNAGRFPKIFVVAYALIFLILYFPRLVGLDLPGAFTNFQYVWHDALFQLKPESVKAGDPRLIMLAIDVDAGQKYGFPLPRVVLARALDKMKAAGVRTVLFDVLFFEPRPGDEELAAATKRFGRVVHLFSQDVIDAGPLGRGAKNNMPVKPLLKAGKFFGQPDVDQLLDNDGHMRDFQLVHLGTKDPLRPGLDSVSLAAAALAADQDKTVEQVIAQYGTDEKVFNFRRPRMWLTHEKNEEKEVEEAKKKKQEVKNLEEIESPFRHIPIGDLLSDELSSDQRAALKGSIVIVGSTALGYYDHYPNPFSGSVPGAEFHLNALDNLLHGDWLANSSRALTMLIILLGIALTYFLQRFSPGVSAAIAAVAVLGWLGYDLWMFRDGVMVEFVPPLIAFVSSYLVLSVYRVLTEGAEKKMIKSLFGQFVAPEVVEQLAQDPTKVKLGGEKRDMTIFFLDIAHFTNISEKMDPEALIQFLNRYLSALSHVILERHGTIDKYIGDCIMAFWNAPIENKDHRSDAILAALECQAAIAELNKTLDPGLPEIPAVRIGINSGTVTVGLTGSNRKLQYTVIGDEVNLASRLEGANKFFGSKIIISESSYEGAKDRVAARYLGRARVVGKEIPIKVYEPLAEKGKLDASWTKALPFYEKGVAAFDARKYDEALAQFSKFVELIPGDGPGQLYHELCKEYSVIAPDATWEGVFNLTAK